MSRHGKRCAVRRVLREAKPSKVHQNNRHRSTFFNPYLQEYVTKRIRKRTQLQTVLSSEPNKYDTEWIGDSTEKIPNKQIRFWFQNANGLIHKGDIREFQFDLANMADSGINYFSFSETCINSNKAGYHSKIVDAYRQVIPTGGIILNNSPNYPTMSNHQPGGVAAGFDGTLRTRFLREGRDKLCRWVWQEFGQSNKVIRIYTLYRVNDGSEYASGENTAWSQQKRLLLEKNITINPRKMVLATLLEDVKTTIKDGINVIIGGDFNESLYSPESMSQLFEDAGLYNVFQHRMNTDDIPRTHARGSKAVDHIWVSKYVLDNIKYAGIAPFGHTYESDHRGMHIDIDESILFNHDDVRMVYHDFRQLKSKTPKRVKKYMKFVEREWQKQKIALRYLELVECCFEQGDKEKISSTLNDLDAAITNILTKAERKCARMSSHHLDVWTPELISALKHKRHCKTKLTQAQKLPNKLGLIGSLDRYKEAYDNYVQAEREYNEICKTAKSSQAEFLKERAAYAALLKDTEVEKEIKNIIEIERQRDQASRIQNVMKTKHSGGPNSIMIPPVTEYDKRDEPNFNHYDINTIWNRIELHNGEDFSNSERITDQSQVERMLLNW